MMSDSPVIMDAPPVVLIRRFPIAARPSLSRTVISWPLFAVHERNTIVDTVFVAASMTEVLFVMIVDI